MKTAMQELIDKLDGIRPEVPQGVYSLAESLLEKEKKQIIDANNYGLITNPGDNKDVKFSGESYYENMYNK